MIAPMKKFLLVLPEGDSARAPHYLRKLGILHIEKFESSGESCTALESALKNANGARNFITSNVKKDKTGQAPSGRNPEALVSEALEYQATILSMRERLADLKREKDRVSSWGNFLPEDLSQLLGKGIGIRLIESQSPRVTLPGEGREFIRILAPKGKHRFALLDSGDIPEGFEEFRLPPESLDSLLRNIAEAESAIVSTFDKVASMGHEVPRIDREIRRLESALTIERLKEGMPRESEFRYLFGYVPAAHTHMLKAEAANRGWALSLDDPSADDMPPTKVENHPAVRIIQPVFDFLGTVPGYREYDISLWFLIFFSLYFAMIFGDGGYGILMLAAAFFFTLKAKRKGLPAGDFMKLVFVLSGTTILWGLVTGTWFALPFDLLPSFLKTLAIPAFSSNNPDSGTNVKIFCFVIGVIQLSLAHLKNIKRDFPNPKFLAQVGTLALVIGMFDAVLNLVIDSNRFPLQTWALAAIGAGFFLVLLFGNWNGNILKSLLEGLKGIIPTFLGTVSVFADIVSYIRLWAVSLAGLAISQTINGMVSKLLGDPAGRIVAFLIGMVVGSGLLVAGHALNFMMSILSVVVHGIRLNMLEFSSHLGMEWSGYPYEPLQEQPEDKEHIGERI